MIPQVIHYCWFGKGELPQSALECINSWKKYCPDYTIKQWDESNFDVNICEYTKEAYAAKKWAFVSDFARFKIIYEHGGIYLDTDVELIQSITDIVEKGPFFGEELGINLMVAPGLGMAAEAGNEVYRKILDYYYKQSFLKKDGAINSETVVSRVTKILKSYGFEGNGKIENINGIFIYPPDYFCPKNYYTGALNITPKTYSIHHYSATWHEPEEDKSYRIETKLNSIFGIKLGRIIGTPVHYYFRFKFRIRDKNGIIGAMKFFLIKFFRK